MARSGRRWRAARAAAAATARFSPRRRRRCTSTYTFFFAEEPGEPAQGFFGLGRAPERAVFIAGERDETFGVIFQLRPAEREFTLRRAQMAGRKQLAKPVIARARFHEHGEDGAVGHGEFAADEGLQAALLGRGGEARRAVETVAIAEGKAGEAEFLGALEEVLGERGAAEEGVGGAGVQLGVGGAHATPSQGSAGRGEVRMAWRTMLALLPERIRPCGGGSGGCARSSLHHRLISWVPPGPGRPG